MSLVFVQHLLMFILTAKACGHKSINSIRTASVNVYRDFKMSKDKSLLGIRTASVNVYHGNNPRFSQVMQRYSYSIC